MEAHMEVHTALYYPLVVYVEEDIIIVYDFTKASRAGSTINILKTSSRDAGMVSALSMVRRPTAGQNMHIGFGDLNFFISHPALARSLDDAV